MTAHGRRTPPPMDGPVIGVLFAGWHTGLILPATELGPLKSRLPLHAGVRYVSFGWGNRTFYMARRPSWFDGLAALFPSASTMLVAGAPAVRDLLPAAATYRWICASRREVSGVDRFLLHSLRIRDGQILVLGPGPVDGSVFLASSERYDALHTCNTWTAAALEQAGLAVNVEGVFFARQLKSAVRSLSACRIAARPRGPGSPAQSSRR